MEQPKSELMLVTPELAQKWLAEANYELQRSKARWQIERLAIEIEKDRFIVGTQIHFCVLQGNWKLINGQHTLAAIIKAGIPVLLTVLTTPVNSEDEVGALYGRHDRHRGRTPHDAFAAARMGQKFGMAEREVNSFACGLRIVINEFRRVGVYQNVEIATSPDYLMENMPAYATTARLYFDLINPGAPGFKPKFHRSAVVAVGLATLHGAIEGTREKAEEFWRTAALDDGLRRDDPRKTLLNFMIGRAGKSGDAMVYLRHVVSCWNAYYEGRSIKFLHASDAGKIGVTIRGTAYRASGASRRPSGGTDAGQDARP